MAVPFAGHFRPGAVRDALGLARLLWAAERDGEADPARLKALAEIGETLADTLRLGRLDERTLGYRAAVMRSEEAVDRLAALSWSGAVGELVRLAQRRVRGGPPPRALDDREIRRGVEAARR